MIQLRQFKLENKIVGCDGLDNIDELQQCIREQLLSNPKSTATSLPKPSRSRSTRRHQLLSNPESTATSLPKPSRSRSPRQRTETADASSLAKQALDENGGRTMTVYRADNR